MADRPETLYGNRAVARVEKDLGRELTRAEQRVVVEEGYVDGTYKDTKGILTGGVGQTGEWIEKGFEASFKHHVDRAKKRLPEFDKYPQYLQAELLQSEYRGDLGLSPTAMKHLKGGKYDAAAEEFLNSDEYRNPKTSTGIQARMRATSRAMRRYGSEQIRKRHVESTGAR